MRAALLGAGILAAVLAWPSPVLVVADDAGAVHWRVPVTEGSPVILQYTNSIYLAPTWERFAVRGGRLALVSITSTREAVLEYNRLGPPFVREGGRVTAPVSGVVLDVLPLRVGDRGHPVLQVGRISIPLAAGGPGTRWHVSIRRAPRLQIWWEGGR